MLITWPSRREMIQHAIVSFVRQDYAVRTLTIVNDGAPCQLSDAFSKREGCQGCIIMAPSGASIGEKRNLGAAAVPGAEFIASFDDDDFSLPSRLQLHVKRLGTGSWLSASKKFIALHTLDNIVGFEFGRCFGAGMIRAEVAHALRWPHLNYCEDQRLFELASADERFGGERIREADDLTYVHRRHETNASAAHRKNLWQGVMPTQLAGPAAMSAVALVQSILNEPHVEYVEDAPAQPKPAATPVDVTDDDVTDNDAPALAPALAAAQPESSTEPSTPAPEKPPAPAAPAKQPQMYHPSMRLPPKNWTPTAAAAAAAAAAADAAHMQAEECGEVIEVAAPAAVTYRKSGGSGTGSSTETWAFSRTDLGVGARAEYEFKGNDTTIERHGKIVGRLNEQLKVRLVGGKACHGPATHTFTYAQEGEGICEVTIELDHAWKKQGVVYE